MYHNFKQDTTNNNQARFTLILLATSLLGVQLISIDIGFFKLSPYRLLIVLAPLFLIKWYNDSISYFRKSINYSYFRLLLIWAFYSPVTLLLVSDITSWLKYYTIFICALIASLFIGLFLKKKDDFIKAFLTIEVIAIFLGIIGFYEIITGDYRYLSDYNVRWYSNYLSVTGYRIPISIFYNPNDFALFCIFSFYISLLLGMIKIHKLLRFISLLAGLSFACLIITTGSRGGFIGFVISVPFFVHSLFQSFNIRHKLSVLISCFIIILISRAIWDIYLLGELWKSGTTFYMDSYDSLRINLIKNGFVFLKDHFFLGTGLGNIEYHMTYNAVYPVGWTQNIHNWWMEVLVSSGLFIFLPYIYLYIRNAWLLYKLPKITHDRDVSIISSAFFGFVIAFVVSSMSSSSQFTSDWIWTSMALIFSFVNYAHGMLVVDAEAF